MRKILLCCLFCLAAGFSRAQIFGTLKSSGYMPDFKIVVKDFYTQYDPSVEWLNSLSYTGTEFEKRVDGWHVTFQGNAPATFLFWNKKDSVYQRISMPEKQGLPDDKQIASYFTDYNLRMFGELPYYGYTGWYKDVINDFRNYNQYPDTLLLGIARAHFSAAEYLLNNNRGLKDTSESVPFRKSPNTMDDVRFGLYRTYQDT